MHPFEQIIGSLLPHLEPLHHASGEVSEGLGGQSTAQGLVVTIQSVMETVKSVRASEVSPQLSAS